MYDELFLEDNNLIKLKKFFKNKGTISIKPENEKIFNEKYNTGSGCFGILETTSNNYFALSGENDYKGNTYDWLMCNSLINSLANEINNSLFNGKYIWATLNDEVKRYINHDYNRKKNNLSYISNSIKLKDDKEVVKEKIGFHYACCERKMQAECNDWRIDKTYYSRWEPCEKCLPSFDEEFGNVNVFTLSKDYNIFNDGNVKLQEFKLKKILILVK